MQESTHRDVNLQFPLSGLPVSGGGGEGGRGRAHVRHLCMPTCKPLERSHRRLRAHAGRGRSRGPSLLQRDGHRVRGCAALECSEQDGAIPARRCKLE
eukprot:5595362-Pyramimonas_sp.AAC.1